MAALALLGFETGSTLEVAAPAGLTIDSTIKRSGNYSGKMAVAGSCRAYSATTPQTVTYTRVCVYITALPTGNSVIAQWLDSGSVLVCNLAINVSGQLRISAGLVGATVLTLNTWHVVELFVDTVADLVECRLNGRREFAGANVMANPASFLNLLWSAGAVGSFCYFDDISVNTTTWAGAGHVIARQGVVGGTPTYDVWSKTGGTIDVVWSDYPFNAATNAQTTAASQKQTMLIAAPTSPQVGLQTSQNYGAETVMSTDAINGCKVVMIGKRASGAANINLLRIVGGTETATAINPTLSDAVFDDGVWTTTFANLGTIEIGVERGATGVGNMIVEDMWLMIDYTPGPDGILGFAGFEIGTLTECNTISNTVAIETTTVRTGGYSAKITHHASESSLDVLPPRRPMELYSQIFLRYYLRVPALPSSLTIVARLKSPTGIGVELKLRTTGLLEVFVNGTTIGVGSATALSINTWYRIELWAVMSPTAATSPTGGVLLRVNGVDFASSGAMDIGGMFDRVQVLYHGTAAEFCFVDDIAVSDTGFIGAGQVIARSPIAGAPTYNTWTKTGGATIDLVWADTPTSSATYAQATVVNQEQSAIIGPFTSTQAGKGSDVIPAGAGILGAMVVAQARVAVGATGSNSHRIGRRVAGTLTRSLIVTPTASRTVFHGPWSVAVADIDTLQVYFQQLDGVTYLMRVEDTWISILYSTPLQQLIDELGADISETVALLVEKVENNAFDISDAITLALSLTTVGDSTADLDDIVTLLASLVVSDGASIIDTVALLLLLGAVADETVSIEDAVSFLLAFSVEGGAMTVSDVISSFRLVVDTPQARYAPRWLIEIEDN